ncbi:hypothetical protein FB451DRAFT_1406628 [Mycena latifolia]|nr:hypothetical protein FB451DRAFT_1406628 [Mycena latifolia]
MRSFVPIRSPFDSPSLFAFSAPHSARDALSAVTTEWPSRSACRLPLPLSSLFPLLLPADANPFPQGDYFPGYAGGDNCDAACDYLLHRSVSLNQSTATKHI